MTIAVIDDAAWGCGVCAYRVEHHSVGVGLSRIEAVKLDLVVAEISRVIRGKDSGSDQAVDASACGFAAGKDFMVVGVLSEFATYFMGFGLTLA